MKPDRTGRYIFFGFLIFTLFDRGLGMILLCMAASKLSACLQRALEEALAPRNDLPFS
jgi:hypothetical protein